MSQKNFSVPNDEINLPREFSSQSEPFSLMNFNNHQQFPEQAESESRDYRSALGQDIFDFQYDFGRQELSSEPFSIDFSQDHDESLFSYREESMEQEDHQLNQNFDGDQNQQIFPGQILAEPQNLQINSQLTGGPMNGQNYSQMSEEVRNEIREHYQSAPILMNSSQANEENGPRTRNQSITGQGGVQIIISSDEQETSDVSLPQAGIDLGNSDNRVMNDMMRQTFVALQSSLDDLNFPQNYAAFESSQTQETQDKIRHMFNVLKRFLDKIKRKCSGNDKIKSIPMKKVSMILFNLLNLNLNREIRHIKIRQIQYFLDECQRLEEGIINEAKHLFRKQVRKLMTRSWIYEMSSRAKFRRRNQREFREFLQKYMQHVAVQLHKDQINPKAFNRDYIIQNYTSFTVQNNIQ